MIQANFAVLRALVADAENACKAGNLEQSTALASAAASFAWYNHAGVFSDAALERLVVDLGGRVPDARSARFRSSSGSHERVVLHIATELYPTGGHTQMLARWISDDSRSAHRVVVTRQGGQPIPAKVSALLGAAPVCLDGRYRGDLRRAAALRRHIQDADIVVVHAHPDDIQPALALVGSAKPCIVVNHASHVFWSGTSIARTVLHLRRSAEELSIQRRGLPSDGGFVANRPLVFPASSLTRADARAHFGLTDTHIVIATAASGNKYQPLDDGDSLVELLTQAVNADQNLVVLAAGPPAEGQWLTAHEATGGRICALGPLPDVAGLFAAADIYVDSFPFASITSLLEAGAHGVPLVSYRGHGPGCEVLGADPPAIEDDVFYPNTADEFRQVVSALAASAELRHSRGETLRAKVAATHSSTAWQEVVDSLYEFAQRPGAAQGIVGTCDQAPQSGPLDRTVAQIQQRTGQAQGVDAVYREVLSHMPLRERVRTWRRLKRSGTAVRPPELLRDVDLARLRQIRGSIRAFGARAGSPVRASSRA
ncbi:MAG: hypothetical protein WBB07_08355 [Mycobacterium sp.]